MSERYELLLELASIFNVLAAYLDPQRKQFSRVDPKVNEWINMIENMERSSREKVEQLLKSAIFNQEETLILRRQDILSASEKQKTFTFIQQRNYHDQVTQLSHQLKRLMSDQGEIRLAITFGKWAFCTSAHRCRISSSRSSVPALSFRQLLVLLAEKPDRSAGDNQLLAALVRLEQANNRAAQARVVAAKLIQTSKRQSAKAERKARAHRLIQQGVLFDLAGLETRSRSELLGLLLAAAKTDDPQRWAHWKEAGDALLTEKGDASD